MTFAGAMGAGSKSSEDRIDRNPAIKERGMEDGRKLAVATRKWLRKSDEATALTISLGERRS